MKKLMLFFVIAIFVSCSNMNSKLENSLSKEIGKEPAKSEIIGNDKKSERFTWVDVNAGLQTSLKNTIDKTIGSLPIKESNFDDEKYYVQYWVYENTENKIEFSCSTNNLKPNTMIVQLYITTK